MSDEPALADADVTLVGDLTAWLVDEGHWHNVRFFLPGQEGTVRMVLTGDGPIAVLLEGGDAARLDSEFVADVDDFLEQRGWWWDIDESDEENVVVLRVLED